MEKSFNPHKLMTAFFEEWAAATPDALAVIFEDHHLTYAELNHCSNQLAHYLISVGVQPEEIVPVCMERSLHTPIALLGILKCGAAYVPIDPDHPQERKNHTLHDTAARRVVCTSKSRFHFPDVEIDWIEIDRDGPAISQMPVTNLEVKIQPHCLAYIMYTSGSTGKPKGVMIEHRSLILTLLDTGEKIYFGSASAFLALSTISFDISCLEIFLPLISGGRVIVVPQATARDGGKLSQCIAQYAPSHIQGTPSLFYLLLRTHWKNTRKLIILVGGESLTEQMKISLLEMGDVFHVYGPTEATIWCTFKKLTAGQKVSLGFPLSHMKVWILAKDLELCLPGTTGEICISGASLARGYLNQPELTRKKFIKSPVSKDPERLYRTGDLGQRLPDGDIVFQGRIDYQVKISGHRIELEEIEHVLMETGLVRQAVVLARKNGQFEDQLIGYYVADKNVEATSIKMHLERKLPQFMIPTYWLQLPAFPLTHNQKTDRQALPDPKEWKNVRRKYTAPADRIEKKLSSIWQKIFGLARISIHDNFFEIGGHSLHAFILLERISKAFRVRLTIREIFDSPNIRELSVKIKQVIASNTPSATLGTYHKPNNSKLFQEVSYNQAELYRIIQQYNTSYVSNLPYACRVKGSFDFSALQYAVDQLTQKHPILSGFFVERFDKLFFQTSGLKKVWVSVQHAAPQNLSTLLYQLAREEFDLQNGPFLKVAVISTGVDETVLFLSTHHIIADGVSLHILLDDLHHFYLDFYARSIKLKTNRGFSAYVSWSKSPERAIKINEQQKFWQKKFDRPVASLMLPFDFPKADTTTIQGAAEILKLEEAFYMRINQVCSTYQISIPIYLLSVINMLLGEWCRQTDFLLRIQVDGRTSPEFKAAVGYFTNTIYHIVRLDRSKDFSFFLLQTRNDLLESLQNQDILPNELFQNKEVPERNCPQPGTDLVFNYEMSTDGLWHVPGLDIQRIDMPVKYSLLDFSVDVVDTGSTLCIYFIYKIALFKQKTISDLATRLKNLINLYIDELQCG